MNEIEVRTVEQLYDATRQSASRIIVKGEISQQLSKSISAYHKLNGSRHKRNLANGAALGGIAFGPPGWLVTAVAVSTMIFTKLQADESTKEFESMPYSDVAATVAQRNYRVASNNGSEVTLIKE